MPRPQPKRLTRQTPTSKRSEASIASAVHQISVAVEIRNILARFLLTVIGFCCFCSFVPSLDLTEVFGTCVKKFNTIQRCSNQIIANKNKQSWNRVYYQKMPKSEPLLVFTSDFHWAEHRYFFWVFVCLPLVWHVQICFFVS